jgi:hypothetical protein
MRTVLVIFFAALATGCGSLGAASGAPVIVSPPQLTPVITESPPPSGAPALEDAAAVRVIVAKLDVRQFASTAAPLVGTVDRGSVFVINAIAPIDEGGYLWWWVNEAAVLVDGLLPQVPRSSPVTGPMSGFIAVGTDTAAFVERLPPQCPATADLLNLNGMLSSERPACFGNTSLGVEGTYGCPECVREAPMSYEPEWLASPPFGRLKDPSGRFASSLGLYFPQSLSEPVPGAIVRVTGHFNDPSSDDCVISWTGDAPRSFDSSAVAAYCRQHFVVERYEVVGRDTSYPAGS